MVLKRTYVPFPTDVRECRMVSQCTSQFWRSLEDSETYLHPPEKIGVMAVIKTQ